MIMLIYDSFYVILGVEVMVLLLQPIFNDLHYRAIQLRKPNFLKVS